MRSKSPLDTLIAVVAAGVLLTLAGSALFGMGERTSAQGATATPTEVEMVNALPTLTPPLQTPTITTTPRPPTETPLPTRTPRPTRTPDPTRTALAIAASTRENAPVAPDRTALPTMTRLPTPTARPVPVGAEHYVLGRPIGEEDNRNPDTYYPYSTTGYEQYPVHHGIEFVNPIGTDVLAAADGEVVFAGSDAETQLGPVDWLPQEKGEFYGNAVVIRHNAKLDGQPIFTLYGHLSAVTARVGQRVSEGDKIGEVGMSGVALGPHLHFEVRIGENSYLSTRNPQLFLIPYAGHGTVIGRVLDASGQPVPNTLLSIEKLGSESKEPLRTTTSYGTDASNPTNPDPEWNENFLFGDIPAGTYLVAARVGNRTVVSAVTVEAGRTSWLWLEPRE